MNVCTPPATAVAMSRAAAAAAICVTSPAWGVMRWEKPVTIEMWTR